METVYQITQPTDEGALGIALAYDGADSTEPSANEWPWWAIGELWCIRDIFIWLVKYGQSESHDTNNPKISPKPGFVKRVRSLIRVFWGRWYDMGCGIPMV